MQSLDEITIIFREAHAEMSLLDLLKEHVLLVEEEYNGGGGEVAVVADTVEQVQTFVHTILQDKLVLKSLLAAHEEYNSNGEEKLSTYHFIVLHEHHVVGAQSSNEDDTGHAFETVDPLLPLRPLAAHVKHPAWKQKLLISAVIALQRTKSADDESNPSPEVEIFEGELGLDDTGGLHS